MLLLWAWPGKGRRHQNPWHGCVHVNSTRSLRTSSCTQKFSWIQINIQSHKIATGDIQLSTHLKTPTLPSLWAQVFILLWETHQILSSASQSQEEVKRSGLEETCFCKCQYLMWQKQPGHNFSGVHEGNASCNFHSTSREDQGDWSDLYSISVPPSSDAGYVLLVCCCLR